jgi:hypothetical protein
MQEDPIFSGGAFKVLAVLLFAAALGVGGYLLADGGGIDIDLPDLPEVDTVGDGDVTTLENTTLEDTTIEGPPDVPTEVEPPPFPTTADEAQKQAEKLNRCVEASGNDPEKIFACLGELD